MSNPCLNGGTCVDRLGKYICACPVGYEGLNCDIGKSLYLYCHVILGCFSIIRFSALTKMESFQNMQKGINCTNKKKDIGLHKEVKLTQECWMSVPTVATSIFHLFLVIGNIHAQFKRLSCCTVINITLYIPIYQRKLNFNMNNYKLSKTR